MDILGTIDTYGRAHTLEITRIQLVRSDHGPDHLYLYTRLPEGTYPWEGKAVAEVQIAAGMGEEWVISHFYGVPTQLTIVPGRRPLPADESKYPLFSAESGGRMLHFLDWSKIERAQWTRERRDSVR